MALPQIVIAGGRTLYKGRDGRFISRAKYELLQRMDPATGRFISAAAARRRGDLATTEAKLRAQLGAPPSGHDWISIASKYQERFEDYLTDIDL